MQLEVFLLKLKVGIWYTRIKNEKKYFVLIPIFLVNRNKFGNSIFSVRMNL